MSKINNLKDVDLFKSLLRFNLNNDYIDILNDYNCVEINENLKTKKILLFLKCNKTESKQIIIFFENAKFGNKKYLSYDKNSSLKFNDKNTSTKIYDFYRGKFKYNNNLYEINDCNQKFFYITFEEEQSIEIFSENVYVFVSNDIEY